MLHSLLSTMAVTAIGAGMHEAMLVCLQMKDATLQCHCQMQIQHMPMHSFFI